MSGSGDHRRDTVPGDVLVPRYQDQPAKLCLGDQQSVEWIAVVQGQARTRLDVSDFGFGQARP